MRPVTTSLTETLSALRIFRWKLQYSLQQESRTLSGRKYFFRRKKGREQLTQLPPSEVTV
jgi:hypothetical protein